MATQKNSSTNRAEVLAPAGSFEALTAAIQAGADAVYFGIEQLNMRARASNNFSVDDLEDIVTQCNQANVKAYLTLNTVLYDHDMQLMRRIMDRAKEMRCAWSDCVGPRCDGLWQIDWVKFAYLHAK